MGASLNEVNKPQPRKPSIKWRMTYKMCNGQVTYTPRIEPQQDDFFGTDPTVIE